MTYSGWNSRRERTSHSLVASLGGQSGNTLPLSVDSEVVGRKPVLVEGIELRKRTLLRKADIFGSIEGNIVILASGKRITTSSESMTVARYTLICYGNSGGPLGLLSMKNVGKSNDEQAITK